MSEEQLSLSWSNHESDRTVGIKDMFERKSFVDVTLVCDDDQIGAHKVLLAAASPFFQNIFERNLHTHPLLYLRGTNKKILEALIDFIYGGEASIPVDDLEAFMSLAHDLQVKGLEDNINEGYALEPFHDDKHHGILNTTNSVTQNEAEVGGNMKDETKNLETLDPNYILYQPNKIELETADYTDLDERLILCISELKIINGHVKNVLTNLSTRRM